MSDPVTAYDPPLSGVRVLDLSAGPMTEVGRLLADLGGHVVNVRLHRVTEDTVIGPEIEGVPIGTAINRHAMAQVGIDPRCPSDEQRWKELLADTDILIESTRPGSPAEAALGIQRVHAEHPALTILSISDFGRHNGYRTWRATTPVLHALTSELSRSGIPGRTPLIPPGELPYHVAAAQAAFCAICVLLDRLRTGAGDLIDFSVLHGAMQALDPPFGMAGSASAGIPLSAQPRGRTEERHRYPIIGCRDGYIRICVLARRQWRGMFDWMGQPAEFADPEYDNTARRFSSTTLLPAIARFFADKTRAELQAQGQRHGVPTAAVLTLDEALATEQIGARGFLRDIELAPGLTAAVPAGITEIDGHRASAALAPPDDGVDRRPGHAPILARRERARQGRPLEGIRVLDLGVIVVGGDTGRLFGDLGAEVIKIENSAFPDGSRAALGKPMAQGFAAGHRNKRAIGINLRDPDGKELVRRLVACSDIVLTNFKPGVINSLGLDYHALADINPGIVVVDSSAFGPTGPWAERLGYGPLVRAAAGLTDQWVYPGEPGTFSDALTVYPDHVCARIGALGALALLIRRERTGTGGSVSVAQSEVMLSHLAPVIATRELVRRGHGAPTGPVHDAPWGLFPTAGDDDWVAITVRDHDDWSALCTAIDRADLLAEAGLATRADRHASRARIDAAVREWSTRHSPFEAMQLLQAAGVPAGAMLRAVDLPQWGYAKQRRAFREESHPHGEGRYLMENVQMHAGRVAEPPLGPAPLLGEQTHQIATELLGLTAAEVENLLARGVLEAAPNVAAT